MKKLGILLVIAWMAACGRLADGVESISRILGGTGIIDTDQSRGAYLFTPYDIAGTVGAVQMLDSSTQLVTECSGVLIARDTVITSYGCFSLQSHTYLTATAVRFPQAPNELFAVKGSVGVGPLGLVVITLEEDVPDAVVKRVAPVYPGNLELAFGDTLNDLVLVGFGESCAGCGDEGVRRVGLVNSEIQVVDPGTVRLDLDETKGAQIYSIGDAGAPLFAFDEISKRYVLVGIPKDTEAEPAFRSWNVFGLLMGVDNWEESYRRYWIAPNGMPHWLPDGTDPDPSWRPLLGWDADEDRWLDAGDNCPPARCIERGIEMWECRNVSQEDDDADGQGDSCDHLSAEIPEFCVGHRVPPNFPDGSTEDGWRQFVWRMVGVNANVDTEELVRVEAKADVCDPVPQLRFIESPISAMPDTAFYEPEKFYRPTVAFHAQPVLGAGSWQASIVEKPDFGFCSCNRSSRRACMTLEGCSPIAVRSPLAGWGKLLSINRPSLTFNEYDPELGEESWEDPVSFAWNWLKDAWADRIESEVTHHLFYLHPMRSIRGVFASTVMGSEWTSRRDSMWEGGLRTVLALGRVSSYDLTHPGDPQAGSGIGIDTTLPRVIPGPFEGGCPPPPWLFDPSRRLESAPFPFAYPAGLQILDHSLKDFSRTSLLLAFKDGKLLAAADSWRIDDVSEQASEGVLSTIGTDLTYVSPVEPHSVLEAFGQESSFVGVGECGEPGVHRFLSGEGLAVQDLGIPLRVELHHRLAFSALEDALYVSGGGKVDRLDLSSGDMTELPLGAYPPAAMILGLAYDPGIRTIYILDVADNFARLRAYHLAEATSSLLWTEPYLGTHTYVSLDVAEDGHLLMTMGATENFSVWRVHRQTGEALGSIAKEGELLRLPTMGLQSLSVLYRDEGGNLRQQDLAAWRFEPGGSWSSL